MVYGAVTAHGGHISVYSELGVGSTFKILLPAVTETKIEPGFADAPEAARGTETVLLAEDEDGVRRLARFTLEAHGYTVLEATNGAEAIALASGYPERIHLLLTDVVMPELSGREAAEVIRAQRPNMKVLFMSGYTDDAVVRHGIVEATDAFLQKPFTPLALVRKVRAVLDGTA
jgi:CheY-like chemotaxis protein